MSILKRFQKTSTRESATLVIRTKSPVAPLREDRHASPSSAPLGFKPKRQSADKTPSK